MFEDVHCLKLLVISVFITTKNYALGTIGSRAPFHSQKQKIATTTNAANNGARTIGDFHGKVTPPWETSDLSPPSKRNEHTHISGKIKSVQPPSVSNVPM